MGVEYSDLYSTSILQEATERLCIGWIWVVGEVRFFEVGIVRWYLYKVKGVGCCVMKQASFIKDNY